MPSFHRRRGFTLIEMMIAIGLSSLLVLVAMAGLRVTAQTVSTANRMSMQNGMLRTAVVAANEEMDFWDTFDSRSDPARRPLRAIGRPFQPLDFTTPTTSIAFDHSNPREWWNGHIWSSNHKRWGDYSIFGKQGLTGDPLVPPERQWRHLILPHLADNLGYFAAMDYLPANFIFGFYNSGGTIPTEFGSNSPGIGVGHFATKWRGRAQPKGKVEVGHDSGLLLTTIPGNFLHPNSHRAIHSNNGGDWHVNKVDKWDNFPSVDFLTNKPTAWPTVTIKTRVAYKFQNFIHESQISVQDPLSGETVSMRLRGLTTTLRGARRQRGLDTELVDPRYP